MEYCSIKEAASRIGVSERWLQMKCKQGDITGAFRINGQGAWMIPIPWVNVKINGSINNSEQKNKGDSFMKKIAFVYDDVSKEKGIEIIEKLATEGYKVACTGEIPIYAHTEEDTLITDLYGIIHNCDFVIGISSSGNGIAIYTNKINGFTCAPVTTMDDVTEAIDTFNANAFDIAAFNPEAFSIVIDLIKRGEK